MSTTTTTSDRKKGHDAPIPGRKMKQGRDGKWYFAKSGCGMKESYTARATGEVVNRPRFYGWNKSKDGFAQFSAFPNKENFEFEHEKNGVTTRVWRYVVTITVGYHTIKTTAFVYPDKGMIMSMPDVRGGMFANPKKDHWTKKVKKNR